MKRIVYISSIAFSDVDISFLNEAKKKMDITYVIRVGKGGERSCALDLRDSHLKAGINRAVDVPYMQRFKSIIDLNKVYIFYKTSQHAYQISSLLQERALYRFVRKGMFDVVHITSFPSFLNPYMFLLRKKLILTVHDPLPHFDYQYKMENANRRVSLKYLRNFILLNKSQKEDFVKEYQLSPQKIKIYDSILSAYTYLLIYNNSDKYILKTPYILFFGNITPYKGVEYLLKAMKMVHNDCSELQLVVAGGGKYYFDLKEYRNLSYVNIQNRFIPDDELATLIRNSEFVVVPYVEATQSGVVMSAYAFDKPCIATNVGGLPEMVENGKYGLVVEEKNSTALSDAIIKLYNDKQSLSLFTDNIHKDYAVGNKSWKQVADSLLRIYNQI